MVFYTTLLPAEIWFIIYKFEHSSYQYKLNKEIEYISKATKKSNNLLGFGKNNNYYDNDNDNYNYNYKQWTMNKYMKYQKKYNNWTWDS